MTAPTRPAPDVPWQPEEPTGRTVAVTALVVVADGPGDDLDRTLAALAAQRRRPDRVVLVDATDGHRVRAGLGHGDQQATDPALGGVFDWPELLGALSVVAVPPGCAFAEQVDSAVTALPRPGEHAVVPRRLRSRARPLEPRARDRGDWLWLLDEGCEPEVGALAALLEVAARSERVGVAGCAVLDAERPDRLIQVGTAVSRWGRLPPDQVAGTVDQGQHHDRSDVLAVSTSGMLLRQDVYRALGGFDPAFDGAGDALDLCWRTHLLGHQVVVVPTARVHRRRTAAERTGPDAATRRRLRQVALARCAPAAMPLLAAGIALGGLLTALLLVLVRRPRAAADELVQATAPLGARRVLGARRRLRRGRTRRGLRTRRSHLRELFVPASAAAGELAEGARVALHPLRAATRVDPPRRGARSALLLAVLVCTAVWWRPLLASAALRGRGHGLAGGALLPQTGDAAGLADLWRDRWSGPGPGGPGVEHPALALLVGAARAVEAVPWVDPRVSVATTVTWLLVAAPLASAVAAHLAARVVTRAAWPRAVAAFAWAWWPTLPAAVAGGRLGPVVAHVLLPGALAGTVLLVRRGCGLATVAGVSLLAAAVGAFAPLLLCLLTVLALVALALARGPAAQLRALAAAALPWALLGPWTTRRVPDAPRALLAGPGVAGPPVGPGRMLTAQVPDGLPGPGWWPAVLLAVGAVVLLRGVRTPSRAGVLGACAVALGAGTALLAGRLTVPVGGATGVPWPGLGVDLAATALLGAVAAALSRTERSAAGRSASVPRRRRLAAGALVVAAGWPVAATAAGAVAQPVSGLRPAGPVVPSLLEPVLRSPAASRVLVVTAPVAGTPTGRVAGREPGLPVTDLTAAPDPATTARVARVARALLTPAGRDGAVAALPGLAVSHVVVTGPGRTQAQALLDAAPGLVRTTDAAAAAGLWRVTVAGPGVPVARVLLAGPGPGPAVRALPVAGSHARARVVLPPGRGRVLAISEPPRWARAASVRLDGRTLSPVLRAGATYRVPDAGGVLEIGPGLAHPGWRRAQGALLVALVLLAVPVGRPGGRDAQD